MYGRQYMEKTPGYTCSSDWTCVDDAKDVRTVPLITELKEKARYLNLVEFWRTTISYERTCMQTRS